MNEPTRETVAAEVLRAAILAQAAILDADHERVKAALREFLAVIEGVSSHAAGDMSTYRLASDQAAAGRQLFNAMADKVSIALSSTNVPLELDTRELAEEYFPPRYLRNNVRPYSCVDVATRLLDEYQPRAAAMERVQAARAFAKAFGLRRTEEPKVVGGRVVMTHGASLDVYWNRSKRYSISSRSWIHDVFRTLAQAMELALPHYIAPVGQSVEEALAKLEAAEWPADRSCRVSVMGIELRMYHHRIDYLVPMDTAAALNIFLSQHTLQPAEAA